MRAFWAAALGVTVVAGCASSEPVAYDDTKGQYASWGDDGQSTNQSGGYYDQYTTTGRAVESVQEAELLEAFIEPGSVVQQPRVRNASLSSDQTYTTSGDTRRTVSAGTVRVGRGDTVYAISRRTGASPEAIIRANNLRAPYHLAVGQAIRIPGAAPNQRTASSRQQTNEVKVYTVRRGDTLYAISRKTGAPVDQLASINRMRYPYPLQVGDRVKVPAVRTASASTNRNRTSSTPRQQNNNSATRRPTPILASATPPARLPANQDASVRSNGQLGFDWPVRGKIVDEFRKGERGIRNDGIDIAAPVGTPVRAAADGEVVYRGAGLDGYGNLLLIRHQSGYVTAYAHNDVMLVRKGQQVRQGQIIAKVGQTGSADQPRLHFEIRRDLKAVDPLAYLGT